MASILDRIEDITGPDFFVDESLVTSTAEDGSQVTTTISNYKDILTRFCKEGVRDVADRTLQQNPKDMHLFCQNLFIRNMDTFGDMNNELTFGEYAVPWKDADGGYFIDNNYILWVSRNYGGLKVPAHEISAEKGLKVEDPESIYYSGNDFRNPVWYRSSSKIYIYPTITQIESGFASMVKFDERFNVDDSSIEYFPEHLIFLIVMYSATKGLKLVKAKKRKEYTTKYSTPELVWQTLYGDSASVPTLPSFPTNLPEFGTDATDFPTMTLPTIEQDVEMTGTPAQTAETVAGIFEKMWNRINDAEETDLFSAEVSRFNTMLSEYNNNVSVLEKRHGVVLTGYSAELNDFTTKFATVMDVWTRYQQSYGTEQSLLDAEIARLEKDYFSYFYPKHYLDKTKEEGSY
jgi:hypothetical protein